MRVLGGNGFFFFQTSHLTSEGLGGEIFEGDLADTCGNKISADVAMGGQAEGQAYADLGARTPIGASGK